MNPFDTPAPNFTTEEKDFYNTLYKKLLPIDTPKLGAFLQTSNLDITKLKEIWDVGQLSKPVIDENDFYVAMKLVALAQKGLPIKKENLSMETGLPVLGTLGSAAVAPKPLPQVTVEDVNRFTIFFENSGPVDGFLSGVQARDVFVKSGLSNEILGKVWILVDRESLGKLNLHSFILAMWIITQIKLTGMEVPSSFPIVAFNSIVALAKPAVVKPLGVQYTGASAISPVPIESPQRMAPLRMQQTGTPLTLQPTGTASVLSSVGAPVKPLQTLPSHILYQQGMTPADKIQYNTFFDGLDQAKTETLTGAQCADFFRKSNLPPTDLAQIWELVANPNGTINREGFASAMCLIKKRIAGGDIPAKGLTSMPPLTAQRTGMSSGLGMPSSFPSAGAPMTKNNSMIGDLLTMDPLPPQTKTLEPIKEKAGPMASLQPQPLNPVSISTGDILSKLSNSNINNASQFEISDFKSRELQLNQKKNDLNEFKSELDSLEISVEDLKKKREALENEFKVVTEKRNNVASNLTQLRTQYAADFESCKELQETLNRENQSMQVAMEELNQYKAGLKVVQTEKQRLTEQLERDKENLSSLKKQIAQITEDTKKVRTEMADIEKESESQQKSIDIHTQLLASSKKEYETLKMDLARKATMLEKEKEVSSGLEKQASVQDFINTKEKSKVVELESKIKSTAVESKPSNEFDMFMEMANSSAMKTGTADRKVSPAIDVSDIEKAFESTTIQPKVQPVKDSELKNSAFDFDMSFQEPAKKAPSFGDFTDAFGSVPSNPPQKGIDDAFGGAIAATTTAADVFGDSFDKVPQTQLESDVKEIVQMGFTEEQSRNALDAYNDRQKALNYLLDSSK